MSGRLLATAILFLGLGLAQAAAAQQEENNTRLDKKEILDLMKKSARMPSQQQNEKMDAILKTQSESSTPRSDFLFCMGLAYWNNVKAQKCVAKAYELGRGIVEDPAESYIWFSLASSEEDQQRVQIKLRSAYPFPSDEEQEEQVKTLQTRIKQYQAEAKQ
jgi:TPR repeat protein